jgi:membrane-associated protein
MLCEVQSLLDYLNPENLIHYGGLTLLIVIIFAESGLFFGFFLPGDSLLFIAGLLSDTVLEINVVILIIVLLIAATSGSTAGYFFGSWAGNYLLHRRENIFFKRSYIETTRAFYEKHGMMAFVMGRFMPIVRTFVPILAGMAKIDFGKFLFFNFLGAAIWIIVMVLAGHLLGRAFPQIVSYIEYIVIGMVLLSAVPVVITWMKNRKIISKK